MAQAKATTNATTTTFQPSPACTPSQQQTQTQPQPKQQRNNKDKLASGAAGAASGIISSVLCAPLDLVKTRLQVQGSLAAAAGNSAEMTTAQMFADIIKHDGYMGCFRGLTPTLSCVPVFWGIYFPLYEYSKRTIMNQIYYEKPKQKEPVLVHVASAICAGMVADVLCNPMFLVRTRMQTESMHQFLERRHEHNVSARNHAHARLTMRQTIMTLYQEGNRSIWIYWRGLTASLLGLSHVAIQFPVYEYLKSEARHRNPNHKEQPLDLLLASGCSKVTACFVTYPHEVVRSRMMDLRGDVGMSMLDTVRLVLREEGIKGLYRGLNVSLIRVVPNCCLTFCSYELILRWFVSE
uniref:Mitochondrial carrier protein n=1 Tax=Leptocylindrus danicus TaxID=163516 RepID=A0A7S2K0U6_9STRA|eukprot:CAMPEP_0116016934 /NCGR_PEP_ID=MMETSP0321-20121206/7762_1 /TAXON_ID=163516 /ORGANISM="Leptocylindrus danicus var. danicus, Strain B650" /LENGTH=350 /DNA_ID=CAMNT_0003487059 /DNA_START=105 /DNA_END=1160 /DNA_ORIENTATION=+